MGRDVGEMIRTNYEQARNRQIILPHLLHRAVQAEPGHHTGAEASEIIFSSGIAEYLTDNFEVLHTQSRQWLMEEIEERLKEQEQ